MIEKEIEYVGALHGSWGTYLNENVSPTTANFIAPFIEGDPFVTIDLSPLSEATYLLAYFWSNFGGSPSFSGSFDGWRHLTRGAWSTFTPELTPTITLQTAAFLRSSFIILGFKNVGRDTDGTISTTSGFVDPAPNPFTSPTLPASSYATAAKHTAVTFAGGSRTDKYPFPSLDYYPYEDIVSDDRTPHLFATLAGGGYAELATESDGHMGYTIGGPYYAQTEEIAIVAGMTGPLGPDAGPAPAATATFTSDITTKLSYTGQVVSPTDSGAFSDVATIILSLETGPEQPQCGCLEADVRGLSGWGKQPGTYDGSHIYVPSEDGESIVRFGLPNANELETVCSQPGSVLSAPTVDNQGFLYWVRHHLGAGGGPSSPATFDFTGSPQSFTVPPGVTTLTLNLLGALGGFGGGFGARVVCDLAVTPGEVLGIYVGGSGDSGGWNGGGGAGTGEGPFGFTGYVGGGASDVRQGGSTLADRVAVAGGGGGVIGGDGGAPNGGDGDTGGGFTRGRGATTTAGGAGGPHVGGGTDGTAGVFGIGGDGGNGIAGPGTNAGGSGGGGGWYGGGGGGSFPDTSAGGGGGGSSIGTGLAETITSHVNYFGDGLIVISWTPVPEWSIQKYDLSQGMGGAATQIHNPGQTIASLKFHPTDGKLYFLSDVSPGGFGAGRAIWRITTTGTSAVQLWLMAGSGPGKGFRLEYSLAVTTTAVWAVYDPTNDPLAYTTRPTGLARYTIGNGRKQLFRVSALTTAFDVETPVRDEGLGAEGPVGLVGINDDDLIVTWRRDLGRAEQDRASYIFTLDPPVPAVGTIIDYTLDEVLSFTTDRCESLVWGALQGIIDAESPDLDYALYSDGDFIWRTPCGDEGVSINRYFV